MALETPESSALSEVEWQTCIVEYPTRRRGGATVVLAAKWTLIVGLLIVAGLWSRVTPSQVVAGSFIDAGAIIVMARTLLARQYAAVVVSAAVAVLFNPLAPVLELYGGWERAALVAIATPFLVLLIWRDLRTAHYGSH